jgi:hypothetical protein
MPAAGFEVLPVDQDARPRGDLEKVRQGRGLKEFGFRFVACYGSIIVTT